MHNCICAGGGFRHGGSFYANGYYPFNERIECSCSYLGAFSLCGVGVNPRVLYGLRQSALVHWSFSRRLVLGGPNHCRLATFYHCNCNRDWSCRIPCSCFLGEKVRVKTVDSLGWEAVDFDSSSDGSDEEMLKLLTDTSQKFSVKKNRRICSKQQNVCEKRNRKFDKNLSEKEKIYGNGILGKSSGGQRAAKSAQSYELPRKKGSPRHDSSDVKKAGSSSSYHSALSVGDLENSLDLISTAEQRVGTDDFVEGAIFQSDANARQKKVVREFSVVSETGSQTERYGKHQKHEAEKVRSLQKGHIEKSNVEGIYSERDSVRAWEDAMEVSGSQKNTTRRASSSRELSKGRVEEEDSISDTNLVQDAIKESMQNEQKFARQKQSRIQSTSETEVSRTNENETSIASSSQTLRNGAKDGREIRVSAVGISKEIKLDHVQTGEQFIKNAQLRRENQILSERSEIIDSNIERASNVKRSFKTSVGDGTVIEEAESHMSQRHSPVPELTEASKEPWGVENVSKVQSDSIEKTHIYRRLSSKQEEEFSTSTSLVYEQKDKRLIDEQVKRQSGSRKESDWPKEKSGSHRNESGKTSRSENEATLRIMNQESLSSSEINLEREKGLRKMGLETGVLKVPQSQLVARNSSSTQDTPYKTHGAFLERLEDKNGKTNKEAVSDKPDKVIVKYESLDSAGHLDRSSKQFVGEFFEKLEQEISTYHKEEQDLRKDQHISVDLHLSCDDTRRSSSGAPGPKGPSDEMWAEGGLSSQEPSTTGPAENSSVAGVVESAGPVDAGNAVVRRSNRSLWGYIGDFVRKGWGSRLETQASTMKPQAKSSSNESASSETWFSGNEPEEDDDVNARKGKHDASKEQPKVKSADQPLIQNPETSAHSQNQETVSTLITRTKVKHTSFASGEENFGRAEGASETGGVIATEATVGSSSSLPLLGISSISSVPLAGALRSPPIDTSVVSREEEFGAHDGPKEMQSVHSAAGMPKPSLLITSSTEKEEISEINEVEVSRQKMKDTMVESTKQKKAEASGIAGKDMELKQRKLQRNMQVPKDAFDQWEEAFKLEQEQRKIDEMFMREALDEAKKAADIWEVPVGAVLVQHGKIIARGCNLVEELRDATAHAEMICIREASNLLRTWRLAETTLYVTLEPCPMCAGAILQARIDAIVWGAPNKLLGADGSWISLFPSENDGTKDSDMLGRPAAPVHPFHPKMAIRRGVLATECADVMQQFFRLRRKKIKKQELPPSRLHVFSPSKILSKMHHIISVMFCL